MDQGGTAAGLFPDILREVAAREHWVLEFRPGTWAEGMDAAQKGEVDLLTSVAYTPERAQFLDYGKESAFTVWSILYAHPGTRIQGVMDIRDRRVGLMGRDVNGIHFRELCRRFGVPCGFREYGTFPELMAAVEAGQMDAGVVPSLVGYDLETRHKVVRTPVVFDPFDLHFATGKGRNADLLAALDAYLKTGKAGADPGYQRAVDRWLHLRTPRQVPAWIPFAALAAGILVLVLMLTSFLFRRQVARATAEVRDLNRRLGEELEQTRVYQQRLSESQETLRSMNERLEQLVEERTGQMQAAYRELEAFSYSVSHDLRAPLRAIDGFSRVLEEDYGPALDAEARRCLERVRGGTRRMGQLIDDLLKLSRVSRGDLAIGPVDLSAEARRILDELAAASPDRSVRTAVAPGLRAAGDPRLLAIALANLLENAWKYTARTPDAEIEFGCSDQEGRPVFRVRDNGAGFDMAYAGKLFQAFQRLHGGQDYEGTGIGLAIVQRIIHRHQGQVWAEAEPDRGATFFFTL
jgi:signal transduction histidine kinase